ncbi:respiratory chain complex I subunit 1 family protein [Halanaerobium sp. ST460_2HS_T2]|uniref:respiratory chain complex I subunit 1 family protein n=1 Tax=Halanaerobium sp. ST460_2HS_T2 TaxID=2183914 RepID=UPI000DF380BB|nr:NADH-quinone oxidoreductase subunit H [Halanaerobium sp. ST460_2HS_T2]RCW61029.1 Membrane bound protein complex subunit mbxM [Halanaerobium sp. ST460_2HS_T2]
MIDIIYRIGHFVLITVFSMALGLLFMGIARKIVARIQKRYGPPVYQPYLDVLKLFGKDAITHGFIFDFGAIMALGGVIATLFFIPLGSWQLYSMEGTVILVIYLLAIASLGMAMGTVGSGNPQASVGISRALMQMLGYELPYLVILFALIYRYQTSSVWGLMQAQAGSFLNWNLFAYPLMAAVAFVVLIGMMGKKPFDSMIAPSEIGSGPVVESGGKYLGMLLLQKSITIIIELALYVNLFLGGAENILIFTFKMLIVWILATMFGSLFPRFRIEDGIKFFWKWPLGIAILQAIYIIT